MASKGAVIANVYTSDAYIPLEGVPVVFTRTVEKGQKYLDTRITDRSGLTTPLILDTPDVSGSLAPGDKANAYALINIYAAFPGYERISITNVQVFPDIVTVQPIQMIPVPSAGPAPEEDFRLPTQNL